MIEVKVVKSLGFIKNIKVNGHANSSEYGSDLICCSVSTLVITLINGISDYIKGDIEYNTENGNVNVDITETNEDKKNKIDVLTNTFVLGIKGIMEENPEYLNLKISEEKND